MVVVEVSEAGVVVEVEVVGVGVEEVGEVEAGLRTKHSKDSSQQEGRGDSERSLPSKKNRRPYWPVVIWQISGGSSVSAL